MPQLWGRLSCIIRRLDVEYSISIQLSKRDSYQSSRAPFRELAAKDAHGKDSLFMGGREDNSYDAYIRSQRFLQSVHPPGFLVVAQAMPFSRYLYTAAYRFLFLAWCNVTTSES